MRLTLVTPPTDDPLTLEEAKAHLRVSVDDEDVLIRTLCQAAAGAVERRTERQLLTATWKGTLDCFPPWQPAWGGLWPWGRPGVIEVPLPPLQSVTSIKYLDETGTEQTWASLEYVVDAPAGARASPGRIAPAVGKTYPATAPLPGAVRVEFVAGYGTTEVAVPVELKQAMLLLVGNWYENREAVNIGSITTAIPLTLDVVLEPFRRMRSALA